MFIPVEVCCPLLFSLVIEVAGEPSQWGVIQTAWEPESVVVGACNHLRNAWSSMWRPGALGSWIYLAKGRSHSPIRSWACSQPFMLGEGDGHPERLLTSFSDSSACVAPYCPGLVDPFSQQISVKLNVKCVAVVVVFWISLLFKQADVTVANGRMHFRVLGSVLLPMKIALICSGSAQLHK